MASKKETIHRGQVRDHTRARVGSPPIHVHNLLKKAPAGIQRDVKLAEDIIDNPEFTSTAEKTVERAGRTRLGKQFTKANVALDAALSQAKRLLGKEGMDKEALAEVKRLMSKESSGLLKQGWSAIEHPELGKGMLSSDGGVFAQNDSNKNLQLIHVRDQKVYDKLSKSMSSAQGLSVVKTGPQTTVLKGPKNNSIVINLAQQSRGQEFRR